MQTTIELLHPDAAEATWLTESEILGIQQELTWLLQVLQSSKPVKMPRPEPGSDPKHRQPQQFRLNIPATKRDQTLRKIESLNQRMGLLYAHLAQKAIAPTTATPGNPGNPTAVAEQNLSRFCNYLTREAFQAATLRLALLVEEVMAGPGRSNPMQVPQLNLRFSLNPVGTKQREIRARRIDSNKVALECNPNIGPADWVNNLSSHEMKAIEDFACTLLRSRAKPEPERER